MRIDQVEYLKKKLQDTVFGLFQRERYANNKEQEKNELRDKVSSIQDALGSIIAVAETFLGMLVEDMKARKSKEKEQDETWIIPFCIEELKKLNKKLEDYNPSNPELEKLSIQEIVSRLALEMQMQNNIMAQALLALDLKKPVNIENNA